MADEQAAGDGKVHLDAPEEGAARAALEAYQARVAEEDREGARALPRPDLLTLVASIAGQAMIHLGAVPHPITRKPAPNRPQARYQIEMVACLDERTRGRRTEEEDRVIRTLLTDLRRRYAQA